MSEGTQRRLAAIVSADVVGLSVFFAGPSWQGGDAPDRLTAINSEWLANMNDVSQWLEANNLGDYAGVLAEHQVDWQALSQLTANDLKEMELPLGPRRKLLTAIDELASSSKGSFRQLIENSELGVIITNQNGVLFVNDIVFKMIGMERPDSLPPDFRFADYHSEEDRAFLHDRRRRRARGEEVSPTFEFPYRPEGREPFWTMNYVQEIVWEGAPAILTWVTDINELKRAEAEWARQR